MRWLPADEQHRQVAKPDGAVAGAVPGCPAAAGLRAIGALSVELRASLGFAVQHIEFRQDYWKAPQEEVGNNRQALMAL
jgi:hypothetical protein